MQAGFPASPSVGAAGTAAPAENDAATPTRRRPVGPGAAGTLPVPPATASLLHSPRPHLAGAATALSVVRPLGAAAAARAAPHGHAAPALAASPGPSRASQVVARLGQGGAEAGRARPCAGALPPPTWAASLLLTSGHAAVLPPPFVAQPPSTAAR